MLDRKDGLRDDAQIAFKEQVVNANHRSRQGILHRCQERIRRVFGNGAKGRVKGCTWNGDNVLAKQLNSGGLTECAVLSLESHAGGGSGGVRHESSIVIAVYGQKQLCGRGALGRTKIAVTGLRAAL